MDKGAWKATTRGIAKELNLTWQLKINNKRPNTPIDEVAL